MKTFIAYSGKSSVTGKLLKQKLNAIKKKTDRRARAKIFLRWGNSEPFNNLRADIELNTLASAINASNKLKMMQCLTAGNIPMPKWTSDLAQMNELKDESGNYYIRNKAQVVRYSNDFNPLTDLYASQPIPNKRREYRVHVFNGKVLAIYEKIPNEGLENTKLFKSHNCKFSLVGLVGSKCSIEGQQIAIDAVKSLGLLFGGCDLIRTKDKKFVIVEVNSAPSLNSINIDRYVTAIKEYVNGN